MKKSTNNKKIFLIILVLIVVILYFIFSLGRKDFIYYKVIKNYDELKKEVNMDAVTAKCPFCKTIHTFAG